MAQSTRLRFRETYARDVRFDEHDGGHRGAVIAQAIAIQGVPGGELGAVGCHVEN